MTRILAPALAGALSLSILAAGAWGQIHDPRALEAEPRTADGPIAPELEGLGDLHHEVTTDNPRSQSFFDQGLRLTYGFNHSEALRAFKEAARLDPGNAMAYWGWALVLGPNLNLPMLPTVREQAWKAIETAVSLKDGVSEAERGYIEALARRYSKDPEAKRGPLDAAYAEAMGELHRRYPEDLDAATLRAAAQMNLTPWDYWYPDGRPKAGTEEMLGTLESVIDRDPGHIGALHYYIHAVEARHPERGEGVADRLAELAPGAGHLVHMPSHIYMRVGRFADSYEANRKAVEADEDYITQCRAQGLYPLGYYPHNIHFMTWAATLEGRSESAMAAARKVAEKIPASLDGNTWGLFENFISQPLYTLVRFGKWDEILAEPKPPDNARFMIGIWHYARGLALADTGKLGPAKRELRALGRARAGVAAEERYVGFAAADTLLTIASEILESEIAAERGRHPRAISHLERAVRLEDTLLYNEPPDWYFPVRQYLGAALLEAGHPAEAEVVYWTDLRKNPENGYSLFGLAKSLEAQGKKEASQEVAERFKSVWKNADVTLTTSRF